MRLPLAAPRLDESQPRRVADLLISPNGGDIDFNLISCRKAVANGHRHRCRAQVRPDLMQTMGLLRTQQKVSATSSGHDRHLAQHRIVQHELSAGDAARGGYAEEPQTDAGLRHCWIVASASIDPELDRFGILGLLGR